MRKILPLLFILNFLMLLPVLVLAQSAPLECCKLHRNITWTDGKVNDVDCTTRPRPSPDPCNLEKGKTVGQKGTTCPLKNAAGVIDQVPDKWTEMWGLICVINTINVIVDWIFIVLVVVVVLFAIMGAMNILTSAGSPEKVTAGRNYIMYAAIGLVVALLVRAVPSIAKAVIGF